YRVRPLVYLRQDRTGLAAVGAEKQVPRLAGRRRGRADPPFARRDGGGRAARWRAGDGTPRRGTARPAAHLADGGGSGMVSSSAPGRPSARRGTGILGVRAARRPRLRLGAARQGLD